MCRRIVGGVNATALRLFTTFFTLYHMKHISILVPEGAILGSLEGTRQILTEVNKFCKAKGVPSLFKVQLVGLTKETRLGNGLFTVHTDLLLAEVRQTDLIIIPALDGEIGQALEKNRAFIPWIIQHHRAGAEVASLCLGAFLLAATGLIKGKKCATHWLAAPDFRKMFPDVHLVTDKIITDEQGIYSSGGAFSYMNLILYLVEKYAGRAMAILSAKVFAIEIERQVQSSFIIFQGQKEHTDEPVKKAQEFIEKHVADKILVEDLASKFAIGRRNFERRFKQATHNTPVEYIQRVKMEAAKKCLETSSKHVSEVMYEVGYADPKAFRTVFKKITGLSPVAYRNRYSQEAIFS